MELLIQIIGWIGALLAISSYLLVSYKKVTGDSRIYQTMNLMASVCIGVNVFHMQAWPALALQITWAVMSINFLLKTKK